VWPETILGPASEFCLETLERRDDVINATASCILQRSTAKRGKSRTEYHSGVEQVGVTNDAFVQACHGLVDQWQYQPVLELGRSIVDGPV